MSLHRRLASFVVASPASDGSRSALYRFVAVESAPKVSCVGPSVGPVGVGPEIVPVGRMGASNNIGPSVVPVGSGRTEPPKFGPEIVPAG